MSSSSNDATKVWSVATGKELYSRYSFIDGSWIVLAPDGRYDSSEGANPKYGHFVIDTPNGPEAVEFDQVNWRDYHVENLAQKIMEGDYVPGEHPLDETELYPRVELTLAGTEARFTVTDQGGGIGRVQVMVGGQVVRTYSKGEIRSGMTVRFDVSRWTKPGQLPVDVLAWNGLDQISTPRQSRGGNEQEESDVKDTSPVRFVALIMGAEKYVLGDINRLQFAGDDAVAMAKAADALAKGLGVKPEIYAMSDEPSAATQLAPLGIQVQLPTRANFDAAVAQIRKTQLTANDILLVYLSGHGVAVGKERSDFVFLTPAAVSGSPSDLADPSIRTKVGVTTEDLLKLFESALASKRMLIIDTCAAEAAASAQGLTQRTTPETQAATLKVVSQESRSTLILLGCPRDAKSYEDPRFGHGLMTYALLETLRDQNLGTQKDEFAVQAGLWFEKTIARSRVLADEIKLTQAPQKLGQTGFIAGRMTPEARAGVSLPQPRPVISSVAVVFEDGSAATAFNATLRERLVEASSARGSGVAFVSSDEAPVAYRVYGTYVETGDKVILKLGLQRGTGQRAPKTPLPPIETTKDRAAEDALEAIRMHLREAK